MCADHFDFERDFGLPPFGWLPSLINLYTASLVCIGRGKEIYFSDELRCMFCLLIEPRYIPT